MAHDVDDAHVAADVVLFIMRSDVNELSTELPDPVSFELVQQHVQSKQSARAAEMTVFEAAMSKLAGEPCNPTQSS